MVEAKLLGRDEMFNLLLKHQPNTKTEDFTSTTKGAIYYVTIEEVIFSSAKVSYFRTKAHLVYIINQNPQFYTPKRGGGHPHPFDSRVTPGLWPLYLYFNVAALISKPLYYVFYLQAY